MSASDQSPSSLFRPVFHTASKTSESPSTQSLIKSLSLQLHVEGGYFVETDRDSRRIPNPFVLFDPNHPHAPKANVEHVGSTRSASTTIYYLLTPGSPVGTFHRNKGRHIHTLHQGRARYVLIHSEEVKDAGQRARVETFVAGPNVEKGEKLQWIVEGGMFKATFLLPDDENGSDSKGLLISETVVPGFEFEDHDFLTPEMLHELVTPEQEEELRWLTRSEEL